MKEFIVTEITESGLKVTAQFDIITDAYNYARLATIGKRISHAVYQHISENKIKIN